jgi:hypothetical protein
MEFDKKIFESVCREYILDTINKSKYLRVRLPLIEHAKIYEWTKNKASHNQVLSLIISEGDDNPVSKEAIQEFEDLVAFLVEAKDKPKYRYIPFSNVPKQIGKAAVGTAKFMSKERHPIKFMKKVAVVTAILLAARYLYKKLSDPCIRQCKLNKECVKNCRVTAINKTINGLRSQIANCKDTPNPAKCEAKIKKEIAKWQDKAREIEAKA